MKRLLLPALMFLSVPSFAALHRYSFAGLVEWSEVEAPTQVSGSFIYNDQALFVYEDEERRIQEDALTDITVEFGGKRFACTDKWEAVHVGDSFYFSEATMDIGERPAYLSLSRENFTFNYWNPEANNVEGFGGKIVSAWFPDGGNGWVPGRDAEPVPEPSSMALMASGLIGLAGYRRFRAGRSAAPSRR